jgi:serine/threonine protein kinase
MSRSIESSSENLARSPLPTQALHGQDDPLPVAVPPDSNVDSEKTAIRQGELIDIRNVQLESLSGSSRSQPLKIATFLIGQQLDHFLIESLVGTGGMGAVFRGHDQRLDRVVAIKVVPIIDRDAETMKRFRFEAQSAAKLDHPNIARVYYVGETEEWSYIVFEFVEGINLREMVLNRGVLAIDDAVCLTRQVAEALQHAWDRKVVHRDIKPSNILVTESGQAKLVDMGLARTTELDKSTNDLTASGVTLGTFDYISPEQAHDPRAADVRSDLYSLGCTLYFLLTGSPPFREGTALQKLLMHGTKYPEDPRYVRDDISDALIAILRKMMAKKPDDRYQRPVDLIFDLRQLAIQEGLTWSKSSSGGTSLPSHSKKSVFVSLLPFMVSLAAIASTTVWMHIGNYQSAAFPIPKEEIVERTLEPLATKPNVVEINSNVNSNVLSSEMDTLVVDAIATPKTNDSLGAVASIEEAIDRVGRQRSIQRILVKRSQCTTSLNELKSILKIDSDLTIQGLNSSSGERCKWTIEGHEILPESVSSTGLLECSSGKVTLQDLDIEWRLSAQTRRKALVALQAGTWLQLKNCNLTIHDEFSSSLRNPGDGASKLEESSLATVLLVEPDSEPSSSSLDNELSRTLIRIGTVNSSARGQCDWLRIQGLQRVEMNLEKSWFAIGGSMIQSVGSPSQTRNGIPIRIDLRNVTSYTLRPWISFQLNNTLPYPKPFVRNSTDSVFAGATNHVEWNANNNENWNDWRQSDAAQKMINWIDLRGVDNTYEKATISNIVAILSKPNKTELVPLEPDSKLLAEERGLETISSWQKKPQLEFNQVHETEFSQLQWQSGAYSPGYQD